jgi:hypothetical protein
LRNPSLINNVDELRLGILRVKSNIPDHLSELKLNTSVSSTALTLSDRNIQALYVPAYGFNKFVKD